MITSSTTQVWVRVDQKSKRVIGVSDEPMTAVESKPVFTVAANFARLDYYVVVDNASATYGFTVRAATAEERAAADANVAAAAAIATGRAKDRKAQDLRNFYCDLFMKRFIGRGFATAEEVTCAASYSGSDTHMVDDVKPLAVKVLNAGNEWRFNNCQPVIDAMYADAGMGVEINDDYRKEVNDALDTFLTDAGFDIAIYKR